jgi:cell division protein FtsZ
MPSIEEFPPQAQRQMQAQQNRVSDIAEQAQQKRKGLFGRLTSGLGRREQTEPETQTFREPIMTGKQGQRAKPRAAEENKTQNSQHTTMQVDPELDDDQLEIPAFLRRQVN